MSGPCMPWGKHRGLPLDEIETSYLVWVLENASNLRDTLRDAIEAELGARFAPPPPPPLPSPRWRAPCPHPTLAADLVSAGVKVLAKRHHPDAGGATATMQNVLAVAEWLRAQVPQ